MGVSESAAYRGLLSFARSQAPLGAALDRQLKCGTARYYTDDPLVEQEASCPDYAQRSSPPGFAVMPAKAIHSFSCTGTDPCLMIGTFNQKYDIVWVALNSHS
jgi:hypothetical protein